MNNECRSEMVYLLLLSSFHLAFHISNGILLLFLDLDIPLNKKNGKKLKKITLKKKDTCT